MSACDIFELVMVVIRYCQSVLLWTAGSEYAVARIVLSGLGLE